MSKRTVRYQIRKFRCKVYRFTCPLNRTIRSAGVWSDEKKRMKSMSFGAAIMSESACMCVMERIT